MAGEIEDVEMEEKNGRLGAGKRGNGTRFVINFPNFHRNFRDLYNVPTPSVSLPPPFTTIPFSVLIIDEVETTGLQFFKKKLN